MSGQTPAELEAAIEVQREQLAHTIDALTAKLDVKSQAQARVADAKATTAARAGDVRRALLTPQGTPRPELAAFVVGAAGTAAVLAWRDRR